MVGRPDPVVGAKARIHFPGYCWGRLLSPGHTCAETTPLSFVLPLAFPKLGTLSQGSYSRVGVGVGGSAAAGTRGEPAPPEAPTRGHSENHLGYCGEPAQSLEGW